MGRCWSGSQAELGWGGMGSGPSGVVLSREGREEVATHPVRRLAEKRLTLSHSEMGGMPGFKPDSIFATQHNYLDDRRC